MKQKYEILEVITTSLHQQTGKDKKEILKEFGDAVFREGAMQGEDRIKRICVTFPGDFQPYHKGHEDVYETLSDMFGKESIWILVSDRISFPSAPLSFTDRKQLILKSKKINVDSNHIKPRKSRGLSRNGLSKDIGIQNKMEDFIFIIVLSIEDKDLIRIKDKETYYQPWPQELMDVSPEEMIKLTRYLPSMKKYGFVIFVDSISSEMGIDYGKKPTEVRKKISKAALAIGMTELRKLIELGELDGVENKLPYDTDEITDDMMEKIIGSEQAGDPEEYDEKNT